MRAPRRRDNPPKRLSPAGDVLERRRAELQSVLLENGGVLGRGEAAQECARRIVLARGAVPSAGEDGDAWKAVRQRADKRAPRLVDELGHLLEADLRFSL